MDNPLNLKLLDRSGIDQQYFSRKDVLIHTILQPVLTSHDKDKKSDVIIYSGRTTNELRKQYGESDLKKLDGIYNKMIFSDQVILVRLVQEHDIQLVQEAGYLPDAVFTVFKDELLELSALFMLYFTALDPKTYLQESLN